MTNNYSHNLAIKQLILTNFKNYEHSNFNFHPKLNALVGNNGVGKTNILDAIHYVCVAKSYFQTQDRLNMRHESEFFRIESHIHKNMQTDKIVCKFSPKTKKIVEQNDTVYNKLAEHIGQYPLVFISPDDIKLINEGSEERRKLIDFSLSQLDQKYLQQLIAYNQLLQQRNSLLKNFNNDYVLLETYNQQLNPLAQYIYAQRQAFFSQFLPLFNHFYTTIAGEKEAVGLVYQSDLHDNSPLDCWAKTTQNDVYLQRTTKGIHKDDFSCLLYNQPAKSIASQGQKKSFLLALKLAQYQLIFEKTGLSPLLLLDDIFDKLDANRVAQLMTIINNPPFGQIFISDTDENRVRQLFENANLDSYKLLVISG